MLPGMTSPLTEKAKGSNLYRTYSILLLQYQTEDNAGR